MMFYAFENAGKRNFGFPPLFPSLHERRWPAEPMLQTIFGGLSVQSCRGLHRKRQTPQIPHVPRFANCGKPSLLLCFQS